jgi:hypothetical protein
MSAASLLSRLFGEDQAKQFTGQVVAAVDDLLRNDLPRIFEMKCEGMVEECEAAAGQLVDDIAAEVDAATGDLCDRDGRRQEMVRFVIESLPDA